TKSIRVPERAEKSLKHWQRSIQFGRTPHGSTQRIRSRGMSFLKCARILICTVIFDGLCPGPIASAQDANSDVPRGAKYAEIFNLVPAQTEVAVIKPEGSRVRMGEMACILDSSRLKDRLSQHERAVEGAEAAFRAAKHAREVAEAAVTHFSDVIYRRQ